MMRHPAVLPYISHITDTQRRNRRTGFDCLRLADSTSWLDPSSRASLLRSPYCTGQAIGVEAKIRFQVQSSLRCAHTSVEYVLQASCSFACTMNKR